MRRVISPTPDAPTGIPRRACSPGTARVLAGSRWKRAGSKPLILLGLGASTGKAVWKQVLSIYILGVFA